MKVKKIYFDMDGVLADFDRGIIELCGLEPYSQNEKWDPSFAERDDRMWAAIRDAGHFYDRLELLPGAEEMFRRVWAKYGKRCEILTGIPRASREGQPGAAEGEAELLHRGGLRPDRRPGEDHRGVEGSGRHRDPAQRRGNDAEETGSHGTFIRRVTRCLN